jgi:LPS O-antigen subunit length determinant protein (WzzB/FepE family)
MKYQYTLEDGAHFILAARDVSDLLDILHGRINLTGDKVKKWKVDEINRQLNRALDQLESALNEDLTDIRNRREVREASDPVEWEPADD